MVLKMRCGWVVRTMDTLPAVRVRPVRTPTVLALPSLAAEALLAGERHGRTVVDVRA